MDGGASNFLIDNETEEESPLLCLFLLCGFVYPIGVVLEA